MQKSTRAYWIHRFTDIFGLADYIVRDILTKAEELAMTTPYFSTSILEALEASIAYGYTAEFTLLNIKKFLDFSCEYRMSIHAVLILADKKKGI